MEPTYSDGDLVVVRERSGYDHGDVIAFRAGGVFNDPTRIIHRIVGDAPDGGFVTQGDNRDRTDPWQPTNQDIIGRAALHIPMAGDVASTITTPQAFAAMGGAAVVVGGTRRRRRRRHINQPQAVTEHRSPPPPQPTIARTAMTQPTTAPRWARFTEPRWAFFGLLASVALAVPALAMTWSALRAPDSTTRVEAIGVVDYGIGLDYRFRGEPSAVYPDGRVTAARNAAGALLPSDPLYSRLLDRLGVTVAFRSDASGAEDLESTYAVDVVVETPGGWSTTLDEVEVTDFDGSAAQEFIIDLDAVAAQVQSVADLTGVGGDAYTITVTPRLEVNASADGSTVDEQLSSPMTFAVEGNLITADAIEVSDSQELTRTVSQRAEYAIGPYELRTQAARAVLSGWALVLVAGIVWFASVLFGGVGLGEPARIAARYRSQIIDVAAATAPPGPVVMVGGIDELARIAKVEQTVILHEEIGDGAHRYRVFLGTVTYEYETAPEHAGAAAGDEVPTDIDETGS